jgi:hypothetical protein
MSHDSCHQQVIVGSTTKSADEITATAAMVQWQLLILTQQRQCIGNCLVHCCPAVAVAVAVDKMSPKAAATRTACRDEIPATCTNTSALQGRHSSFAAAQSSDQPLTDS